MKVLLTGASGFVGGAVWRRARELGWEVLALGRRPLSHAEHYRSIDLSAPFDVEFQPDVVIHAAARSSPWGRPHEFEQQCVATTRHVLDFCARHGHPHVVHISTAAVLYRDTHQLALTEATPFPDRPINLYAGAKTRSEQLVNAYAGSSCILRPRAVFGPEDTVVFPRILRALERRRLPRFQSDRPVLADLIYIDTLAEYIVRAAAQRARGIYHLSQAEPVEIYAFLDQICTALNLTPPSRRVPVAHALRAARALEFIYRALPFLGEPPVTTFGVSVFAYSKTLDVTRALRDLGPPAVSLDEGLRRFLAWQRAQSTRDASSSAPLSSAS